MGVTKAGASVALRRYNGLSVAEPTKQAFPSRRQASCVSLKPCTYPPYIRDLVDFDYAGKLSPSDRQWLAAFAEEYYKGFYQKKETQVTPLEVRRAACAARKRVREHKEPLVFPAERQALARELHAEQPNNVEDEVIRGIDRRRRGRR